MERVCKGFTSQGEVFTPGEVADFTKTVNYQRLINQRFISRFDGEEVPCTGCSKKFDSSILLAAHKQLAHPKDRDSKKVQSLVPDGSVQMQTKEKRKEIVL